MAHEAPTVEVQVRSAGSWVVYCDHAHWDLKSAEQCQRQAMKDGYTVGRVLWLSNRTVAWEWPLDDGMSDVEPVDFERRDAVRRGDLPALSLDDKHVLARRRR